MANGHAFEHLPLLFRKYGPARLSGGGTTADETKAARADRPAHANKLSSSATNISQSWQARQEARTQAGQPVLPAGVPLLLEIDPGLDIDDLRHHLGFEVVSEEEDGFVIVASDDVELKAFLAKINNFTNEVTGSAVIASVHELDRLSGEYDVLIIQSMGNLKLSRDGNRPGIQQLLQAGKQYPDYLDEPACRIANPAQSFQALSVGSVARGVFEDGVWKSFATETGMPSAFSRAGLGLWGCVKPEVVEYGGDCLYDTGNPPSISTPNVARDCYPQLLRSTADGGPAHDRDQVGTSFAAPLVSCPEETRNNGAV